MKKGDAVVGRPVKGEVKSAANSLKLKSTRGRLPSEVSKFAPCDVAVSCFTRYLVKCLVDVLFGSWFCSV
jgi:hypothetical protein